MRWNCPHCQASLYIIDEKIGGGWAFSQCYQCKGYSLVRKSEVNLIKVTNVPAGETVHQAVNPVSPPPLRPMVKRSTRRREPSKRFTRNVYGWLTGCLTLSFLLLSVLLYRQGQRVWDLARSQFIRSSGVQVVSTEVRQEPMVLTLPHSGSQTVAFMDALHQRAMAPNREISIGGNALTRSTTQSSPLVRVRADSANLRSGPGLTYPIVGTAKREVTYRVKDFQGSWLRIATQETERKPSWIRNDLVEVINP